MFLSLYRFHLCHYITGENWLITLVIEPQRRYCSSETRLVRPVNDLFLNAHYIFVLGPFFFQPPFCNQCWRLWKGPLKCWSEETLRSPADGHSEHSAHVWLARGHPSARSQRSLFSRAAQERSHMCRKVWFGSTECQTVEEGNDYSHHTRTNSAFWADVENEGRNTQRWDVE